MGNIAERKYHLIQLISSIEDEKVLAQIQEELEAIRRKEELIAQITRPMKKTLDVEELKREQNWKPIDREEWDRLVEDLDIQEPIDELLLLLSK